MDDIITVVQWKTIKSGHASRNEENDWQNSLDGVRLDVVQRKAGVRLWKDCRTSKLNEDDAMDCIRWRKLITDIER